MANKKASSLLSTPTIRGRYLNERAAMHRFHSITKPEERLNTQTIQDYKDYFNIEIEPTDNKNYSFEDNLDSSSPESGAKKVFGVGDSTVTITDGYGIRSWGKRKNEHSTGIDYTTNNGKAVALTDFVVEEVRLQGVNLNTATPEEIKKKGAFVDTNSRSAGWYIIGRLADGSKCQYMHLDPMTIEQANEFKGKSFKKGDKIWGYMTGSGSGTGKHVKYRIYKGHSGTKSHVNPLPYIFKDLLL